MKFTWVEPGADTVRVEPLRQPRRQASARVALQATWAGGLVFLAMATVGSLLTFTGMSSTFPQGLVGGAFGAALLAWAVVVVTGLADGGTRRRSWREVVTYSEDDRRWLDALPTRTVAAVMVCILVLGVGAISGISDLGSGSPTEMNGRYYSNNHGELTELSEQEFNDASAGETRLMAAVAGVFLGCAAVAAGTRTNRLQSTRSSS